MPGPAVARRFGARRLVAQAMTREVATVRPDAGLGAARRVAEAARTRHLLVLDSGNLVGILCLCDLAEGPPDCEVSEVMSVPVLTVRPDATVAAAAQTMRDCDVGCLPVVVGGLILGIVSQEELGRAARCGCHRRAARPRLGEAARGPG